MDFYGYDCFGKGRKGGRKKWKVESGKWKVKSEKGTGEKRWQETGGREF